MAELLADLQERIENGRVLALPPDLRAVDGNGSARGVALDAFRDTLSRVPAAVTIVTAVGDDERAHGTTVSAFCSLSADPPLVLVALDRGSELLGLLPQAGRFAVNLLAVGQEEIGVHCAKKGKDKLASIPWRAQLGLPRIDGAAAWLACDVEEFLPGGDHVIVVGLVVACDGGDGEPLVYHRRTFHALAEAEGR